MTAIPLHDVKQPNTQHNSVPRRIRARGLQIIPPREGWGRRQAPGACEAPVACLRGRPGRLRGAPASLAIGTPRLSALLPVAIFGLGSAFPASAFPPKHVQPAPGSTGRSARRAVSEPPGAAVTSHDRGTPLLAPPSGSSPETPLLSEDVAYMAWTHTGVNPFPKIFSTPLVVYARCENLPSERPEPAVTHPCLAAVSPPTHSTAKQRGWNRLPPCGNTLC